MPPTVKLRQGISGTAPAAWACATALHRCGHQLLGAHIAEDTTPPDLDALTPGGVFTDLDTICSQVDLLWLASRDLNSAVAALSTANIRPGLLIAHANAGIGLAPLAPLEKLGATILAFTPVIPLQATSLSAAALSSMPLAVSARTPFVPVAQALAVDMGADPLVVADTDLATVAAASRLAGAHVANLCGVAERVFTQLGIDKPTDLARTIAYTWLNNSTWNPSDPSLTPPDDPLTEIAELVNDLEDRLSHYR